MFLTIKLRHGPNTRPKIKIENDPIGPSQARRGRPRVIELLGIPVSTSILHH
ncbi:hypothetical protein PHJA_002410700 [Phtheirospermum japonicum]|uniref:Uncharacterized protein n=1 Tax=Phtheirospermum japonicum TaxID=374723 RepID=A0A830CQ53_9LAMI|nr:hypothetical protein PHJA_002410700 [Phtheirospermum japonicum]